MVYVLIVAFIGCLVFPIIGLAKMGESFEMFMSDTPGNYLLAGMACGVIGLLSLFVVVMQAAQ